MLPYLARDKNGVAPFDCDACRTPGRLGYQDVETRQSWHCGFLPEEEWTTLGLTADMFYGEFAFDDGSCCDLCPGYLATLPQVAEVAEATWALRKQVLPIYYEEPSAMLLEGVRILDQSYSRYEARSLAEPRP